MKTILLLAAAIGSVTASPALAQTPLQRGLTPAYARSTTQMGM